MNPFAVLLVAAALKGFVLLVAAELAARLLRRQSASLRHLVWTLAMAGLLALPPLGLLAPRWRLEVLPSSPANTELPGARASSPAMPSASPSTSHLVKPATPSSSFNDGPFTTNDSAMPKSAARLPESEGKRTRTPALPAYSILLPAFWLAGALAVLAPLGAGLAVVARLRRRAFDLSQHPDWAAEAAELSAALGLRRPARLLLSPDATMPMAIGIFRPAVLLPREAAEWDAGKRRAVLLHELAHVRRRDGLTHAMARAALALHWFNPLAWLAMGRLRAERERACDDMVIAAGSRPSAYAELLLTLARTTQAGALAGAAAITMARPSQLEGRLLAILDATRNRRAVTRRALGLAVLVASVLYLPLLGLELACSSSMFAKPAIPLAIPERGPRTSIELPLLAGPYSLRWTERDTTGTLQYQSYDLDRDGDQDVILCHRDGRPLLRQWLNEGKTCEEFVYENGAIKEKRLWQSAGDREPFVLPFRAPAAPATPKLNGSYSRVDRDAFPKEPGNLVYHKKSRFSGIEALIETDAQGTVRRFGWRERWGKGGRVWSDASLRPDGKGFYITSRTYTLPLPADGWGAHAVQGFKPDGSLDEMDVRVGLNKGWPPPLFRVRDHAAPMNTLNLHVTLGGSGPFLDIRMPDANRDGLPDLITEDYTRNGTGTNALRLEDANHNGFFEYAEYRILSKPYDSDDYQAEVQAASTTDDGHFDQIMRRGKGEEKWSDPNARQTVRTPVKTGDQKTSVTANPVARARLEKAQSLYHAVEGRHKTGRATTDELNAALTQLKVAEAELAGDAKAAVRARLEGAQVHFHSIERKSEAGIAGPLELISAEANLKIAEAEWAGDAKAAAAARLEGAHQVYDMTKKRCEIGLATSEDLALAEGDLKIAEAELGAPAALPNPFRPFEAGGDRAGAAQPDGDY